MASNPTMVRTVSWLTTKPSLNAAVKSGNFFIQNGNWHLQLSYDDNSYSYRLTLLQGTKQESLKKPFRVIAFCCSPTCDTSTVNGYCKTVNTTNEVICSLVELLDDGIYCNSGEINIMCIFHDLVPASSLKKEGTSFGPDLESLTLDFCNLLKDQTLADVTLRCGDQTMQAHKIVLSARSEVFAAMFHNKMTESKTAVIELPDLNANVLQLFLQYLYSGLVSDVPDDLVPELYVAGDKYALRALQKSCSDHMVGCLTKENCISRLMLANAHSDADFKEQVMSFICRHEVILVGNDWLKFSKENMSLALEVCQYVVKKNVKLT